MNDMKMNSFTIIIIGVVIAAGAFFGGIKYQESKSGNSFVQGVNGQRSGRFMMGNGQNRGMNQGMRPVAGEILSTDETSVTVKMMDGSSKIIILSDKTTINKAAIGTKSDLKTGETIAVFGSQNSDGSVTAQSIQLNPQMQMFRRGATGSAESK